VLLIPTSRMHNGTQLIFRANAHTVLRDRFVVVRPSCQTWTSGQSRMLTENSVEPSFSTTLLSGRGCRRARRHGGDAPRATAIPRSAAEPLRRRVRSLTARAISTEPQNVLAHESGTTNAQSVLAHELRQPHYTHAVVTASSDGRRCRLKTSNPVYS